jgi:hypothetical protein
MSERSDIGADGSPDGIKKMLSYLLTDVEKAEMATLRYRLRVVKSASSLPGICAKLFS